MTRSGGRIVLKITATVIPIAPVGGATDRRIAESLDSGLRLGVAGGGRNVTESTGGSAGIEIVGDIESLLS